MYKKIIDLFRHFNVVGNMLTIFLRIRSRYLVKYNINDNVIVGSNIDVCSDTETIATDFVWPRLVTSYYIK